MDKIVFKYGGPKVILTDGGTPFLGEFDKYLKGGHIVHQTALPYQHQTNGMAERMIRNVEQVLRAHVGAKGKDWDSLLPSVQFSLNSAKHSVTKVTPYEAVFGKPVNPTLCNTEDLMSEMQEEIDGWLTWRRRL